MQLADIDLEAYLFVKLSEVIERTTDAKDRVRLLLLIMENLILSSTYSSEFQVLINEVKAFSETKSSLEMRRLKATVERIMRLAKRFTNDIAESF